MGERPPDPLLASEHVDPGATIRAFWQADLPPDVTPFAVDQAPMARIRDLPPIVFHDPAAWATREDAGLVMVRSAHSIGGTPPVPVPPPLPGASAQGAPPAADASASSSELAIDGVLGEGGSGRVLLARERSLDREVAVKVPRRSESFLGPALIAEARLAGRVEHPNVVPIHGLHRTQDGAPVMVMKRIRGVEWAELLEDPSHPVWQRFPERPSDPTRLEQNLEILLAVSQAIVAAHRTGIIHRDIKPANVLVAGPDEVYLTDWGLALELSQRRAPGQVTALVGTPAFMAPEMALGEQSLVDERTDVYQLGATLCFVVSGRHRNPGATAREMVDRLKFATTCELPASTPPGLAAICARATAYSKAERYPTAQAFLDAVRAWFRVRDAERVAFRANERLTRLEAILALRPMPDAERDRAFRLAIECQTSFEDALQLAPDNGQVRAAHARFLERWVGHLVEAGELATARAFMSDWPGISELLRARVQELERRSREREEKQARLTRLEHELDLNEAASARRKLLRLATLYGLGALAVALVIVPRLLADPEHETLAPIAFALTTNAVFWIAVAIGRRHLLKNAMSRRIIGFLGLMLGAVLVHRVVALVVLDLSLTTTTALECLLHAALSGLAALTLSRAFWPAPVFGVVGFVVAVLVPPAAPLAFGVSLVAAFTYAGVVWGRGVPSTRPPT
ncbi:MAG: serine/threonine-protein kinase [Myxococcota bacterium]